MATDNNRKKRKQRRDRITGWIIAVTGAVAAIVAWTSYSASRKTLTSSATAHQNAHGAAGVAVAGFVGLWVLLGLLCFATWGCVHLARRKPEPERPVSRGRRARRRYAKQG